MSTEDILAQLRAKVASQDQAAVMSTLREMNASLLQQYGLQLDKVQCPGTWSDIGAPLTFGDLLSMMARALPPLRVEAAMQATLQNLVNQVVK